MNANIKMHKRLLYLAALATFGGGALSGPLPAQAATFAWNCTNGFWHYTSCWSPTGNPGLADDVTAAPVGAANTALRYDNLTGTRSVNTLTINSGTANTIGFVQTGGSLSIANSETIGSTGTGSFTQTGGTHTVSNVLYLGNSSGSNSSYNLNAGILTAGYEFIGHSGTGNFTQSGGTHVVSGNFYLGSNSGGNGSYNLNTGSLSAISAVIGDSGTGNFTQSGGTHTVGNSLTLGTYSDSNGSYNLNTGSLSAISAVIGDSGTGNFTQSGGTHVVSSSLYLGSNSGGNGSYSLNTGSLSTFYERVGNAGTGVFTQSGGTNTVGIDLILGYLSGSNGTYILNGGTLNVGNIVNGSGIGTFNLDGGTLNVTGSSIAVDTFRVGNASGSNGSFSLGSGKTLSVGSESLGVNGSGALTQTGGTHTVSGNLTMAANSGSSGTYTLSGGSLNVTGNIVNGVGSGTFTLDGGTLNLTGSSIAVDVFRVGNASGSNGSFTLSSGKTLTAGGETIGGFGTGSLTQTGGIHTVSNNLILGSNSTGNGTYTLSGGTLNVGNSTTTSNEFIGSLVGSGTGTFIQTGGTHNVANDLYLGPYGSSGTGTYDLSGGTLNVRDNIVNTGGMGSLILNGGTLTVNGIVGNRPGDANGNGSIDVDNLVLGKAAGANVSYTLSAAGLYDGTHKAANTLAVNNLILGESGIGNFTQNGLTRTLSNLAINNGTYKLSDGSLTVNNSLNNNGTLALAGGTLTNGATLTQGATGTLSGYGMVSTNINSAGTVNAKSGNLIINSASFTNAGLVKNSVGSNLFIESPTVNNAGNIEVNSAGSVVFDAAISNTAGKTLNMLGGTLATPTLTNTVGGTVTGFGTLTGNLNNAGSVNFYGPTNIVGNFTNQASGTLLVRNDQTLVTGQGVNNGTIHTFKGTVIFNGGLINNGVYLSDPSNNYFTDLVVNDPGYLVGETGDKFIISGNFENHSLQNTLWNTNAASLLLNGSGTQNLYLAGGDLGAILGGYANNFAWGEFSLGSGVSAHLWDGNADPSAALYVGLVELGGGLGQIGSIYSDFNIYYDPTRTGNAYLGGQTFALNGTGFLMPVSAVPVPPAVWLFGSGLLGLVGIARRRRGVVNEQP